MLKFLSSLRITVVCLFLLFVLTFWGTIAQVQQGLYAAQERFFTSFFFLAGGWFPFPGAQLVLWVLFINLVCALISHFNKHKEWAYIGSKIAHAGLLLYFVAAFFIFHLSQESYVDLGEGEVTAVSSSYSDWELAYWKDNQKPFTVGSKNFKAETVLALNEPGVSMSIERYFTNSDVVPGGKELVSRPLDKDREKNIAGGVFDINGSRISLFGGEDEPKEIVINGRRYFFLLRRKQYPLPFVLRLDRFKAQFHPGTNIAKSYESWVTITTGSLERKVRIYMNNPLRYKDYTLYQASYQTDSKGRQYSILAVVKNSARILPYIACFAVFFGLALHFLIQALAAKSKVRGF